MTTQYAISKRIPDAWSGDGSGVDSPQAGVGAL
jgi:hypothetical protein